MQRRTYLHLHFYLRCVADGMRPHWKTSCCPSAKGFVEVVTVAWKLENAVQPVRNRVASEIVFQPLHPETGASIHVERVDCSGGLDLHLHFYLRGVTDEIRPHWKHPVDLVRKSLLEVFNVAWKLENAVQPVWVWVSIHLPRRTSTTRRCGRRWWGS